MGQAIGGLDVLGRRLRGGTLVPGDGGYDAARANWNLAVEQRPGVVVEAACAADVAAAVDLAHDNRLPVAVRSTGHGPVRPCDGGVLIDVGRMRSVSLDAAHRRVRVSAGARWTDVLARTTPLGLSPPAGFAPSIGAVGETLGGGFGWLLRKHGSALGSMLGAEVVTAEGRIVQATPETEPELFDALRGGHGNFGVVTALDLGVVPTRTVVAGGRAYPAERTREVLRFFRDWAAGLPPEVTAAFALTTMPAEPSVPEELRGRRVATIRACALAGALTGRGLIAPLASLGAPLIDTFRHRAFGERGAMDYERVAPAPLVGHCELFAALPDEAVDAILELVGPGTASPFGLVEVRHIGDGVWPSLEHPGFVHREADFLLRLAAEAPSPARALDVHAYGVELGARLRPHTTGGTSLNFLGTSNGPDAVRRAYTDERYAQLVRHKAIYDPENVFRFCHNIPPGGPGVSPG